MARLVATVGLAFTLISTAAAGTPYGKPGMKPSNGTDAQKYCVAFDDSTGSRVTRTECHTRAEWKQLGVDIDDLLKK